MSVNFAEIQKSLSEELGCDNSIQSILDTLTVTRAPIRGYEPPSEYKVTKSSFKPWLTLYIAKQQGISANEIAEKVFAAIQEKKGIKLTADQKKNYFANVGTVNANLKALGKDHLVVATPKISNTGDVSAKADITAESFGLADLFA